MPAPARDDLRRLHFINALFAHVTGHDLYLAKQIKEAIAFSLAELEDQTREHPEFAAKYDVAFNASAARLLESFFAGQPRHGFYHWDALSTLTSATPRRAHDRTQAPRPPPRKHPPRYQPPSCVTPS